LVILLGTAALPILTSGCGAQIGAMLYHLGLYPRETIEKKCELTGAALLILVDDDQETLDNPRPSQYLAEAIQQELAKHEINTNVIDQQKLNQLRMSDPKFNQRGAREIGQQLGAEQVLWLQIQDYNGGIRPEDIDKKARYAVTVKVINSKAKTKEEVRLWPPSTEGELIQVNSNPHEHRSAKSEDALAKQLSTKLAEEVVRLFRDYLVDETATQSI
jgi:hypothetical protein